MADVQTSPVIIPANILVSIGRPERELKIDLAIFFYKEFQLSAGKSAQFAGLSRVEFWQELAVRKVAINYDESDALHDVEAMRLFGQKHPAKSS